LGGQHEPNTVKTFVAQTAGQWRKWLDKHHDSESEVWLIFHKVHTGVASIAYLDAPDEALCFGWVDSLVKMPATLPRYIQTALRTHPAAWRYFEGLAPSHRRRYVGWVESAKREETKARRLQEAIRLLAAEKPLGLK
jgi:uncharacterized protein YdeI (YjbR/CyaY-like superfamily)